ncbi:MAG: LysM peptidoglycan-binding domain-containing protein, partial [Actinomycetia bacterium]|nr:LysM peptidoglycan-binding domain-containing protein [Actinomycetes bacterium]
PTMRPNSTSPGPSARARRFRTVWATTMTGAAAIGLSACGRSAPVDALSEHGSDPDIAGVSVTSPDAVVSTVPTSLDEATTTSTIVVPQQILYTVQAGDTLSVIASSYNVTTQDLADYNGITDVNNLSPGQELAIPPKPISTEATAPTETTAAGG